MNKAGLLILLMVYGQTYAEEWTACSKPCGGGTKTMRNCQFATCHHYASVFCNTQPCAPSTWDTYTPCSQTCGGGYRFKVKRCPANDVNVCKKYYEECNAQPCPFAGPCPGEVRFGTLSSCCNASTETCGVPAPIEPKKGRTLAIGRSESDVGQWPWAAAIVIKEIHATACSGTLIHKDWVLTAAHCIPDWFEKDKMYVLLGSTSVWNPDPSKQVIGIRRFVQHDMYDGQLHDIGLVRLAKSAVFNQYVRPICLPRGEEVQPDMKCVAAGWGIVDKSELIGDGSKIIPKKVLYHVPLSNLPEDACVNGLNRTAWDVSKFSDEDNLCYGALSGGKDSCISDTGGPIMCQRCSSCGWYVAGTASYECGDNGKPGIYMNVKSYEYWIRKKIYGYSVFTTPTC